MTLEEVTAQFGKQVRAIREQKGLKSSEVAEGACIEVKHLGRIERGEKRPSFELIIALANTLEVSPVQFFQFDSEATNPKLIKNRIFRQLNGRSTEQLKRAAALLEILLSSSF